MEERGEGRSRANGRGRVSVVGSSARCSRDTRPGGSLLGRLGDLTPHNPRPPPSNKLPRRGAGPEGGAHRGTVSDPDPWMTLAEPDRGGTISTPRHDRHRLQPQNQRHRMETTLRTRQRGDAGQANMVYHEKERTVQVQEWGWNGAHRADGAAV